MAPVMEHNGIPIAESGLTFTVTEDDDHEAARLDVLSYGGWLEQTAFSVSFTRGCRVGIDPGCTERNPDFPRLGLFVDTSVFGAYSGTTPAGAGSATWTGAMVAGEEVRTSAGNPESVLFIGDARVRIDDLADPDVDVSLTSIHNVTGKTTRPDMTWRDIPVEDGLFGSGSVSFDEDDNEVGDYLVGMFNGPRHQEVGGRFRRDGLVGAFGAKRAAGGDGGGTPDPVHAAEWWLPENARSVYGGDPAGLESAEIPRTLAGVGYLAFSSPLDGVFHHSTGKQVDGEFVRVLPRTSWPNRLIRYGSKDRSVMNLNGVPFVERNMSMLPSTPPFEQEFDGVIGVLDYASFGIWLKRDNTARLAGSGGCCDWELSNYTSTTDTAYGSSIKRFSRGTYRWEGAMVGGERREPEHVIMGEARVTLDVRPDLRDQEVSAHVLFSNIRDLHDGAAVPDMSWRLTDRGSCTAGACSAGAMQAGGGFVEFFEGTHSLSFDFSGPNHENVYGTFQTSVYQGAFGGKRR